MTVPRSHLITVNKNAEEPEYGHLQSMEATIEINDSVEEEMKMQLDDDINGNAGGSPKKTQKKHPWIASQESFLSLSNETKAAAKTFEHCYRDKPDEKIVWTILGDDKQITTDAMKHPSPEIYSPLKINIPWSRFLKDISYKNIFFKYFFPSLEGKVELMDEYLWDRRCTMYLTVVNDKIKFYDSTREDPDSLVCLCITVMVVAMLSVHSGIENLWKSGETYGLKEYSNFGRHIPVNYFCAFVCSFPYVWGNKMYWFKSKNDLLWNMFLPFVNQYNDM